MNVETFNASVNDLKTSAQPAARMLLVREFPDEPLNKELAYIWWKAR
jgi:hypothetical protein